MAHPSLLAISYGLSFGLGHLFIHWSEGLQFGFWNFFGANFLIGSAYIFLYLGLAEMISVMPFSGGCFGFTRVTLSPFLGMVSGFGESADYGCQMAFLLWNLSEIFVAIGMENRLQPAIWFSVLAIIFSVNIGLRSYFSIIYTVFPLICTIFVFIYLLGNASVMDLDRVTVSQENSHDNSDFFRCLPFTTVFYIGLEAMPLWCKDIEKPALHVPRAMVICIITIFILATAVVFGVASTAPGIDTTLQQRFPLTEGLMRIFATTRNNALLLTGIPVIATLLPFIHAMAKQLAALLRSKMIITPFLSFIMYFKLQSFENNLESVSLFGFMRVFTVLVLAIWFIQPASVKYMYNLGLLTSIIANQCTFLNFIIFRTKYGQLKRNFVNPFGIFGAVYGMMVFTLLFISVAFLQDDGFLAIIVLTVWYTVMIGGYLFHWRFRQVYSAEESAILFLAHVMKANEKRRSLIKSATKHLRRKGQKSSPDSTLRRWLDPASYRNKSDCSSSSTRKTAKVIPTNTENNSSGEEGNNDTSKLEDKRRSSLQSEKAVLQIPQQNNEGGENNSSRKLVAQEREQGREDSCVRMVSRGDIAKLATDAESTSSRALTLDPINPLSVDPYVPMPTSTTPTRQSPSNSRRISATAGGSGGGVAGGGAGGYTPSNAYSSDDGQQAAATTQGRRLVDQIYQFFDVTQVLTEKEAIAQYRENYGSALMPFPAAVHNVYSVEDAAGDGEQTVGLEQRHHQAPQQQVGQQHSNTERRQSLTSEETFFDLLDVDEIVDTVFHPQHNNE